MSQTDSVACLVDGLKGGRDEEIRRLWDLYFERLVRLAAARLPRQARRVVDEEDIALSAFRTFCDRAGRGEFARLEGRDELWKLLATIATRKLIDAARRQSRQKRGGGRVFAESDLDDPTGGAGIDQLLGREPTPEAAAVLADETECLLNRLTDPTLRAIALRRLEGRASTEIAAELGTTARTIDRKLGLIRAIWSEDARC